MFRSIAFTTALGAILLLAPGVAEARGLGVEVWTDRGNDAVYQPGDDMTVEVRTSDDAWLLVYEIDTEGYVRVLHPYRGRAEFVEGGRTIRVPDPAADVELVVQQSVGQSYIVALASYEPFRPLPWFLRPYSAQEEALGYEGEPDDEEGITAEGRIVGDPFVAMERIRRRVLEDPDDDEAFGTSYASYFVQTEVRYPRYLCYDCHRPGRWSWWDGFDPYYTDCTVFRFRVNWSWYWGPSYWHGHVPYFVYVYRPDCPPRYTRFFDSGIWYSAWDGWNRWCENWGSGGLRRYKTAPPVSYVPPARWKQSVERLPAERRNPPGFLASGPRVRSRDGVTGRLPSGRSRQSLTEDSRPREGSGGRIRPDGGTVHKPGAERSPAGRGSREAIERRERGERRPSPVYRPREESRPPDSRRDSGQTRRREAKPAPGSEPRREPERRQPEARQPERREPERRQPEARQPERREPERREPERREPERREPERREPSRPSQPPPPRVERQRDPSPPPQKAEPPRESRERPDFPAGKDKR